MGNNYYWHGTPACPTCGRRDEPMHIGKSSAGWRFSFQGYPDRDPPIMTWQAWKQHLQAGGEIIDEYGHVLHWDAFVGLVEGRQHLVLDNGERLASHYEYMTARGEGLFGSFLDPEGYDFIDRYFS